MEVIFNDDETNEQLIQSAQQQLSSQDIPQENVAKVRVSSTPSPNIDHICGEVISLFPNLREIIVELTALKGITGTEFESTKELTSLTITESKVLRKLSSPGFPSKLIELRLHKNAIAEIDDSAFSNLKQLQELYLEENSLATISRNTFAGLTELLLLDLGENKINSIENGAFWELTKIQRIDINDNQLTTIHDRLFDGLINLNTLLLNGNQLTELKSENSLYSLMALQLLHLQSNSIHELDLIKLAELPHLKELVLTHNRINLENYVVRPEDSFESPLEQLFLGYNNVTTIKSLEVLRIFPNLKHLEIQGNAKELIFWDRDADNIPFLPKLQGLVKYRDFDEEAEADNAKKNKN